VLGLGAIVFLHELGHFAMAKKNKVRVEAFSLGFGPVLWKRRHGETEYRLSLLPLGGYVKMAGEMLTDDRSGEPWELTSKTPWQRFQIFVAGAVMNLIIAFPIAILCYWVGKYESGAQIGAPGYAESLAGIRPGDEILQVGSRKIDTLDQFRIEMIRRSTGTEVPVRVRRGEQTLDLTVRTMSSSNHGSRPTSVMLGKVDPESILGKLGVRAGDEIEAVDGKSVVVRAQAEDLLKKAGGREARISIRRRNPDWTVTVDEHKVQVPQKTWHVLPYDEHLFQPIVADAPEGLAAKGKIKPGDVIVRVGQNPIRCWRDLRMAVEPSAGVPIEIEVLREGKSEVVTLTPGHSWGTGMGAIGIERKPTKVAAHVVPGSAAERAGLKDGDELDAVPSQSGPDVTWGHKDLFIWAGEPKSVDVEVRRKGEDKPIKLRFTTEPRTEGDLQALGVGGPEGQLLCEPANHFRERTFSEALAAGLREPVDIGIMTFEVLRKLVTGGESPKGLSGPIGIAHVTFLQAEKAFGNFLWLLCLITVNLGIFNLLPIPVLDGGHNVLLLIEVVRKWFGKPPPSEKFVATFQYAGLIFILFLFVYVTFNDVGRLWGRG
jgi:regulator of sigma E protease